MNDVIYSFKEFLLTLKNSDRILCAGLRTEHDNSKMTLDKWNQLLDEFRKQVA